MILLRDIKEGDIIIGIVANEPVTIKMVSPHGENALEVIYKKPDNSLGTKLLFTEDEEKLSRRT
ncbi:MAG: hypothetical protein LBE38_05880, partial [Deltaproteobacteria bacterium]|nr:hypothetical protein [Deltaproteobacteria bacterium]